MNLKWTNMNLNLNMNLILKLILVVCRVACFFMRALVCKVFVCFLI